jgi:predicted NodU family carbamoyl transferase
MVRDGDGRSCIIYVDNGQFKQTASAYSFDSLGNLCAYIIRLCRFKAVRDEGEITGLPAYGDPNYVPEGRRYSFLQFARLVIAEHAHKCFKKIKAAENMGRFVRVGFSFSEWMAQNCPGAVHIDSMLRSQLIRESDNPSAYGISTEYCRLTRFPRLINASSNVQEEPIVWIPYDAIRTFVVGHIDYVAIGNWKLDCKESNSIQKKYEYTKI